MAMSMPWRDELLAEQALRHTQQLWRNRTIIHTPQGARVQRDGRELLNFSSNDYLGLAGSQELRNAMADAAHTWGAGSGASHMVCGHLKPHHELECELASFVDAEKAILFSTGYMANLAIPSVFLNRHDLLLEDKLNHASMIDGGLQSRASMSRYRHLETAHADELLATRAGRRKMIMSDAVFSMDGDQAPIESLHAVALKHNAVLVLDDAHGFGVLGDKGAGSLSLVQKKASSNTLMVGTLGKAAGTFGAFVAGDAIYIDTLLQHARPYIYTTALPPAVAEATRTALRMIANDSWRRDKLNENIRRFRAGAEGLGLILSESRTPIQPVLLGDEASALQASQLLQHAGLLVTAIRPPTVPRGSSRLRIALTAEHTSQDIDRLLTALSDDAFRSLSLMSQ
jgi:8-amino-7-oxononanoate synthase